MIAPRPLAIEVGIFDELFDVSLANKEIQKVSAIYDALGIGDRLFYREFEGGHEYGKDDAGKMCIRDSHGGQSILSKIAAAGGQLNLPGGL